MTNFGNVSVENTEVIEIKKAGIARGMLKLLNNWTIVHYLRIVFNFLFV